MRTLLAKGTTGELVKRVQSALTSAGFNTNGIDGRYGQATLSAVNGFQAANSLPVTGAVDDGTWPLLMHSPVPTASERCLQLTAAFEGHGFGLAEGNFDGALLTWGIIGFTMAAGEVQSIVLAVNSAYPARVRGAFGGSADELIATMQASRPQQEAWADAHTGPNGSLVEPWRTGFASFGSFPEVQAEQMKHVRSDYLAPATGTAQTLGLKSELALALCFDIHVQNGGIKPSAMSTLSQQAATVASEQKLRVMIANAVADSSDSKWQADVRQRKLTIATGSGLVHGGTYVLEDWGLSNDYVAAELMAAEAATGSQ